MALPTFAFKFAALMMLTWTVSFARQETAAGAALVDLEGRAVNPFGSRDAKLLVFVFVRTDCPIANAYAPEIQRLQAQFAPRGVTFWLVYPDADESPTAIRQHLHDFNYSCGALRDPRHLFARQAQVSVTPEAALFRPDGDLLYHGRIDDRYVDFGKIRSEATRHDLEEALTFALAGKPVTPATAPAIGCFIEDVK
jgi:hypothetical protein